MFEKRCDIMVWQKVGYPAQGGELFIRSSGLGEIGVCVIDEESHETKNCIWFDDLDKAKKGVNDLQYKMKRL